MSCLADPVPRVRLSLPMQGTQLMIRASQPESGSPLRSRAQGTGAQTGASDINLPSSSAPATSTSQSNSDKTAAALSHGTGLPAHATASTTAAVSDLASGVKSVVADAVKWAEKKANALSKEGDEVGLYASPATCVPSDLDPMGCRVMPALEAEKSKSKEEGEKGLGGGNREGKGEGGH